jgi:uncharacterized protein
MVGGATHLLILQPTPFCNIDCKYCYLLERNLRKKMSLATVEAAIENVSRSGLLRGKIAVVWHAGEPLTVGVEFYRKALEILERFDSPCGTMQHHIQTNGMLVNPDFCRLFAEYQVNVGISLDGPDFLHDRSRKTRAGKPTHAAVMRGLRLLQEFELNISAIAVLTYESLLFPNEIFDFFVASGIKRLGFNVEELEGPNTRASISLNEYEARLRSFMRRFMDLSYSSGMLHVREFWRLENYALRGLYLDGNSQSFPLAMVNVDVDGNFTTFSPEFLGVKDEEYGNFILGNVHTDLIADSIKAPLFQKISRDIAVGLKRCKIECAYFPVCGGGDPSNKYFENHDLMSTETKFCKTSIQAISDVFLEFCEETLALR